MVSAAEERRRITVLKEGREKFLNKHGLTGFPQAGTPEAKEFMTKLRTGEFSTPAKKKKIQEKLKEAEKKRKAAKKKAKSPKRKSPKRKSPKQRGGAKQRGGSKLSPTAARSAFRKYWLSRLRG